MPWVVNLDISNNRIETFYNLKQMKKLHHLNFFNNNITYLAPFAFTTLDNTELKTINTVLELDIKLLASGSVQKFIRAKYLESFKII